MESAISRTLKHGREELHEQPPKATQEGGATGEAADMENDMELLTQQEIARLAAVLSERKRCLREEIREGLARVGSESYADLLGSTTDAGDESIASLLRDVAHAEVGRDIAEWRDIATAERRIADSSYGICTECGANVGYKRLKAYPTAKRCLSCQRAYEKTHALAHRSRL